MTVRRARLAGLVLLAPLAFAANSQAAGWGSGTLTSQNLHDLISQMTTTEEIGMVHGEGDPPSSAAATADCTASAVGCVGEAGWIPGVKRLGIPPLRLTDGPAGIRNGEGLAFDAAGRLFATQHGRDQLYQNWPQLYTPEQSADLPAEELLVLGQGVVYALQVADGVRLVAQPTDPAPVDNLTVLVIVLFGLGIARAWEFTGADNPSLLDTVATVAGVRVPADEPERTP